jgi:hypothetical protein
MVSGRRSDPFREMEDLQDRRGQRMDWLFGLVPSTVAARLPMAPATSRKPTTGAAGAKPEGSSGT